MMRLRLSKEPDVCAVAQACGTCQYINGDLRTGLARKHQAAIDALGRAVSLTNVPILGPVPAPRALEYRCYAKLAARAARHDPPRRYDLGLFKPGSHTVTDIRRCPLHHRAIARCLQDLARLLDASCLRPYDEARTSGDVRYVLLRASHVTGELMLTIVANDDVDPEVRALAMELRRIGHPLRGAYINVNRTAGNAILGPVTRHLVGRRKLQERIGDVALELGPLSFFQINPYQAESIARRIAELAGAAQSDGEVAWDLYSGVGAWGLTLAHQGFRVFAAEEIADAVSDANANAALNDLQARYVAEQGAVEAKILSPPGWANRPSVVVANPSRRGMDRAALDALVQRRTNGPFKLFYVACDGETLARDLGVLLSGGFRLLQIETFDMFPATDHIEWLVVLC